MEIGLPEWRDNGFGGIFWVSDEVICTWESWRFVCVHHTIGLVDWRSQIFKLTLFIWVGSWARAYPSIWRQIKIVHLWNRGENDLIPRLDIQISEWIGQVGQKAEVCVLNWLSWALQDTICVVDLQVLNDSVVIDCKLRPLNILLHLWTELFKVPVGIQVDLKFDLLSTWVSRTVWLVLGWDLIEIIFEILVLNLHSNKQLDSPTVCVIVSWHKRRRRIVGDSRFRACPVGARLSLLCHCLILLKNLH